MTKMEVESPGNFPLLNPNQLDINISNTISTWEHVLETNQWDTS